MRNYPIKNNFSVKSVHASLQPGLDMMKTLFPKGLYAVESIEKRCFIFRSIAKPIVWDQDISIENKAIRCTKRENIVRIYRPKNQKDPLPALIYIHGGGMILGGLDGNDAVCVRLARKHGCIVIS